MQAVKQEVELLEELRLLIELQGIDAEINDIEKEKATLPVIIESAAAQLRQAEAEASEAGAASDAATKKKSDVETELTAMNDQLQKLKLRTTDIKSNKEYFAHLKEIEDTERRISELEDSSLQLMDSIKEASEALTVKDEILSAEKEKFEHERSRIEKGFEESAARLAELNEKRAALLPGVPERIAMHYNSMLRKYPDSAVALAERGTCTGCRMTMPPQMYNNVRKGETIITCNNCKRILYYVEP